jgi:hypothetical protein
MLVPAVAAAAGACPLVVLGEGTLAHKLKFERPRRGSSCTCAAGRLAEDVLRALGRASALVFPSCGTSRFRACLLEALALGTPTAAMDTGGTREILEHERSGLLRATPARSADAVRRLAWTSALRERLREGARGAGAGLLSRALVAPLRGRVPIAPMKVALLTRAAWPLHDPGGMERAVLPARDAPARAGRPDRRVFTRPPEHDAEFPERRDGALRAAARRRARPRARPHALNYPAFSERLGRRSRSGAGRRASTSCTRRG